MTRFYFIFLYLIFIAINCNAQFFEVKKYGIDDGLKSDYLLSLFYDSKGFLWVSDGNFGVSRFDGNTFKNFNDSKIDIVVNSNFAEINGKIRFVSGKYIYEISGDSICSKFEIPKKAYTKLNKERSIIALKRCKLDADGVMWMSPESDCIYAFDSKNTLQVKTPNRKFVTFQTNNEGYCCYVEEKDKENIQHILRIKDKKIVDLKFAMDIDEVYLGTLNNVHYTFKRENDHFLITEHTKDSKTLILLSSKDYSSMGVGSLIRFKNKTYIGLNNGLLELNGTNYKLYPIDSKKANNASPIIYDNKLLFGNYCFDGKTLVELFPASFLPSDRAAPVLSIETDNEKNIWYATIKGLFKVCQTPIRHIEYINALYGGIDNDNHHYIFFRNGTYRFDSLIITDSKLNYIKSITFPSETNNNLQVFNGNKYFISGDLKTYWILKNDLSIKKIKIDVSSLIPKTVRSETTYITNYQSIFSNRTGYYYFINGRNLVVLKEGKTFLYELPSYAVNTKLKKLYLTKNEELYICFDDLILKFDHSEFQNVNLSKLKSSLNNCTPILNNKDSIGLIIIPNDSINSIYFLNNNSIKLFKIRKELDLSLVENTSNSIKDNYFWINSNLFIPYEGFGFLKFKMDFLNNEFQISQIGKNEKFPTTRVSSSIIDKNNYLWIFNNIARNIICYRLNDFLNENYENYKEYFGSPLSGYQKPVFDSDGNLYVTVDEGLVIANSKYIYNESSNKNPFIENIYSINKEGQKLFLSKGNLNLQYHSNITFEYNFIKFNDNKDLKFAYKLEGLDLNWQPETKNRFINYNNLPAGTYNFHLKVFSNNRWIETNMPIKLFVRKPFWQEYWFIALMIATLLFLIWFLIKIRELRLKQKQDELEKKISLATIEIKGQKHLIEEKHKEITDSINYAERIQRSFLATSTLLDNNLKDYFVYFRPKDVVSGDFYWAKKLRNGNFALTTADSTGHGVPGAIMSLLNVTSIEAAIKDGYNEPAEIFNNTRNTIIERLKMDGSADGGKDGMDASLICFDFKNSKFTYASANNPIWIVRDNELIELKGDKMPVGKHDKDQIPFTQYEFEMNKADVIYTLTDGFPDQFGGAKGKKYMYKQLKETLISISQKPMSEQKEELNSILKKWMGDTEQVDDITIIGIRV